MKCEAIQLVAENVGRVFSGLNVFKQNWKFGISCQIFWFAQVGLKKKVKKTKKLCVVKHAGVLRLAPILPTL